MAFVCSGDSIWYESEQFMAYMNKDVQTGAVWLIWLRDITNDRVCVFVG